MKDRKERKERKIKELALDSSDSNIEIITEDKKSDNSFYDQDKKKDSTTWTKDWRAKTLGVSIIALVFLGTGIPAGMAMTGYFNHNSIEYYNTPDDYREAEDLLNIWKDDAILNHYISMVHEGYISQSQYKVDIKNANSSADDIIDEEKNSMKSSYGNEWEDAWDNSLQSKGFHSAGDGGEEEYKNSMIADEILSKELKVYTTYNILTNFDKVEGNPNGESVYISNPDKNDDVLSIDGVSREYKDEDKDGETIDINEPGMVQDGEISFTSEELMSLYILTYEPIVYNQSLLSFSLLDSDGTPALDALSISVTKDNMENALAFYKQLTEETGFEPAAEIFTGIQSSHNLSLNSSDDGTDIPPEEPSSNTIAKEDDMDDGTTDDTPEEPSTSSSIDNVAVGMWEAGVFTKIDEIWKPLPDTPTNNNQSNYITNIILDAFNAAIEEAGDLLDDNTKITTLSSEDIEIMSNDLDTTEAFEDSLNKNLTGKPGKNTHYPLSNDGSREYVYNISINTKGDNGTSDVDYAMYISTAGLNIVGEQISGSSLIDEQLNYNNETGGYSVDYSAFDSYNTWLTSNFENILLLNYIFDLEYVYSDNILDDNINIKLSAKINNEFYIEHEEDTKINTEIIRDVLLFTTTKNVINNVMNNFISTDLFVKENDKIFTYNDFVGKNSDGWTYYSWLIESHVYSFYSSFYLTYPEDMDTFIILSKGSDE